MPTGEGRHLRAFQRGRRRREKERKLEHRREDKKVKQTDQALSTEQNQAQQTQALDKRRFEHEKKKYQDERDDKLREQVTQNQQRREAMKKLWEGDPRGEIMLGATGGASSGGGGGGGASAGLSRKDALAQATREFESEPPTAEGPSINEYVDQRVAEIMQQSPQPQTLAGRMREFRARRDYDEATSLQNLQQNLTTSYVDAEGSPISAEGVQRAEGGQHYGVTPEGQQAFRKFSLAGVGYDLPSGGPPEESIAERGFQLSDAQRAAIKEKTSRTGSQGEKVDTDETPPVTQALQPMSVFDASEKVAEKGSNWAKDFYRHGLVPAAQAFNHTLFGTPDPISNLERPSSPNIFTPPEEQRGAGLKKDKENKQLQKAAQELYDITSTQYNDYFKQAQALAGKEGIPIAMALRQILNAAQGDGLK